MPKVNFISFQSRDDARDLVMVLGSEDGKGGLTLTPIRSDFSWSLRLHRCPAVLKPIAEIFRATGIDILDLQIHTVEEGVIAGKLRVRQGDTVHEIIARPGEAAFLIAALGGRPIYVDEECLYDWETLQKWNPDLTLPG